jgi:hypothetical protein
LIGQNFIKKSYTTRNVSNKIEPPFNPVILRHSTSSVFSKKSSQESDFSFKREKLQSLKIRIPTNPDHRPSQNSPYFIENPFFVYPTCLPDELTVLTFKSKDEESPPLLKKLIRQDTFHIIIDD